MAHARRVTTVRTATEADLRFAARAIASKPSASDVIVIEEATNISAAVKAEVAIGAVYAPEGSSPAVAVDAPQIVVRADQYRGLFPTTRVPRVFATARLPRAPGPKSVARRAGDFIVLDGAAGPGNIGSVIRLAAAYRLAAVVVLGAARRDLYRRGVIRASSGAIFTVPVLAMAADELIVFASRNDVEIVATSPHGGRDVRHVARWCRRLAIVFGSETTGLSDILIEAARRTLHIPMPGDVESLNLSSAVAIVLFERHAAASPASLVT